MSAISDDTSAKKKQRSLSFNLHYHSWLEPPVRHIGFPVLVNPNFSFSSASDARGPISNASKSTSLLVSRRS